MDKLRNEVTLVGMPIGNRNDNGFKKLSDLIEVWELPQTLNMDVDFLREIIPTAKI